MTRVGSVLVAIPFSVVLDYQGTPPRTSWDVANEPECWSYRRRNAWWYDEICDGKLAESMHEVAGLLLFYGVVFNERRSGDFDGSIPWKNAPEGSLVVNESTLPEGLG